jgi:ketosteroid isomerase-like protein
MLRFAYFVNIIFIFMIGCTNTQYSNHKYKNIVHTFNEAWNTGELDLLDKTVHPDYLKQEGDEQLKGVEPLKNYVKNYRESMPDVSIEYVEEIYGANKAAIRFTLEGTPSDTKKKFKAEGIVIFQFKDGKIISDRSVFDQLTSLKQQGYIIVPPQ